MSCHCLLLEENLCVDKHTIYGHRRDEVNAKPEGNIRVILAAPLETASRLIAANDSGTLHIIVRNPLDGDAERGPEVLEYPTRTITVKQQVPPIPKGLSGGGGNNTPSFPVPDLPPVTVSQNTDTAPPMPMPVGAPVGRHAYAQRARGAADERRHGRARHGKNPRPRAATVEL